MHRQSKQAPELKRADTNDSPTVDNEHLAGAPAQLDELLERGEISPETYAEYSAAVDAALAPSVNSNRHTHSKEDLP